MLTPPTRPVEILLVEDDDGDAKAVRRAFEKARILNPMQRVMDGIEALEALRGENGRPKVQRPFIILLDINMPRMNGFQLLQHLRDDDDLRQSIVFILTTSKREQDRLAAYEQNVAGYITKERAGEDFLDLVTMLESYWRVVELP